MTDQLASGFDHVILAVRDLDHARARFAELGFTLSDRGSHPTRGTANFCVMFANGYIELLGVGRSDCQEQFLLDFLQRGEGFSALALAPRDIDAAHTALARRGLAAAAPNTGSRVIERADGTMTPIRFRVLRATDGVLLPVRAFFCRHLDRDLVYAPGWMRHANGATRIISVTIDVLALPVLDEGLAAELGWSLVVRGDEMNVDLGSVVLRFRRAEADAIRTIELGVAENFSLPEPGILFGAELRFTRAR